MLFDWISLWGKQNASQDLRRWMCRSRPQTADSVCGQPLRLPHLVTWWKPRWSDDLDRRDAAPVNRIWHLHLSMHYDWGDKVRERENCPLYCVIPRVTRRGNSPNPRWIYPPLIREIYNVRNSETHQFGIGIRDACLIQMRLSLTSCIHKCARLYISCCEARKLAKFSVDLSTTLSWYSRYSHVT